MSLSIMRVPITGTVCLALANKRARLSVGVPTHALLVVNAAVCIEPNDGITRAMGLRRRFARKELQ